MAINMKEWGMMPYPSKGVQVPTYGINRWWGDSFEQFGRGLGSVGRDAAEMLQARDKVASAGDLAGFYGRLQDVVAEAGEELRARDDVKDWDYAWNEVCTPLVRDALREVPYESREAARNLAAAYTSAASLEQRRDAELERISGAREQWRHQLDAAVDSGDAQQAALWLEQGRGIFVPDAEMDGARERAQSGATLSQWRGRLQREPMRALGEMNADAAPLPLTDEDRRSLQQDAENTRRSLQTETAEQMADDIRNNRESSAEWVQEARAAGVISDEQASAAKSPRRRMSPEQHCQWMRRIDETAPENTAALRLDICTAAHPLEERRELLRQLDEAQAIPAEERRLLSGRLWNMYRAGRFGTPGDAPACRRLAELQQNARRLLADGNEKALSTWLAERGQEGEKWVCYQA